MTAGNWRMNNSFTKWQWEDLEAQLCRRTVLLYLSRCVCYLRFGSVFSSPTMHKFIIILVRSLFVWFLLSQPSFFPGFYSSSSSVTGCLPCLCHTAGSVNQVCDKLTGQCICQDASVTGQTCECCKELYFGFDSVTGRWVSFCCI